MKGILSRTDIKTSVLKNDIKFYLKSRKSGLKCEKKCIEERREKWFGETEKKLV